MSRQRLKKEEEEIKNLKEKLKEKFRKNPVKFGTILAHNMFGSSLLDYQKKFLADLSRRIIWVSGRQLGKTTMAAIKAIWYAYCFDDTVIMIIARSIRQAKILFRKIRLAVLQTSFIMDDIVKLSVKEIVFKNRSRIFIAPVGRTGEYTRGFTCDVIIVDEAGYVPDEVMSAILPSIAVKKGTLILIGSPSAKGGFFYEAWRSPEYSKHHIKATDSPLYTKDFIEEFRKLNTEVDYKREILGEFADIQDAYFDMDDVKKVAVLTRKSAPQEGYVYYGGLDIAMGHEDQCAVVFVGTRDGETLEQHTFYTRSQRNTAFIVRWVLQLIETWKPKLFYVDATGVGAGVFDLLKEKFEGIRGLVFSSKKRTEMYSYLRLLIEQRKLKLINDKKFLRQFENYKTKFSGHFGFTVEKGKGRDDIVDALALACYGFKKVGYKWEYLDINIDELWKVI